MGASRLIASCARIADTTSALQELAKKKERQDIDDFKHLNADAVWYVYAQVFAHIGTAAVCGGFAAVTPLVGQTFPDLKNFDAASAVTIGTKVGEVGSTLVRAGETRTQGQQRVVEHKLNKGPEKRFDEFFQQYIRWVQEYQQAVARSWHG
jgi:hypothetical protein